MVTVGNILLLVVEVLWALVVSTGLCFKELFHFCIFDRRQKCVKDKVVVITGTGHGLGRRMACIFAKLGANVVCLDFDSERNQNTVWDIRHQKGKAVAYTCDITDRSQMMMIADEIRRDIGDIDIFVSCAGIYPVKDILSWTPDELYELFDTNVMSQFWMMQAVIPHMKIKKSGQFVAISSAAAVAPVSGEVPYSITKSALTGLMDGMIQELKVGGHDEVKITTVHPYYTASRDDIPVRFDLRFGRMSPDFVAKEIVKGIRQEQEIISIPRFILFWIYFMKVLPFSARQRWRDIFYTRVFPKENPNRLKPDGTEKNIVEQFRLPPISATGGLMGVIVEGKADINDNSSITPRMEAEQTV